MEAGPLAAAAAPMAAATMVAAARARARVVAEVRAAGWTAVQ